MTSGDNNFLRGRTLLYPPCPDIIWVNGVPPFSLDYTTEAFLLHPALQGRTLVSLFHIKSRVKQTANTKRWCHTCWHVFCFTRVHLQ